MPTGGDQATAVLQEILRDPARVPNGWTTVNPAALVEVASRNRVLVLLGTLLRASGRLDAWPAEFSAAFRAAESRAVAMDCIRQRETQRVLAALAAARVRALVWKGAAVAYTYYPAPHVRPRSDTDLIVAAADVPGLERALKPLGYAREPEISGELVSYQSHYSRRDEFGLLHALDVHWKISNAQALADCLPFEELWTDRATLPALGPGAFVPCDEHSLVLALVHRAGHHPGSKDLLWLYDLHLIANRLTPEQMARVLAMAMSRGLSRLVAEGLDLSRQQFGTANVHPGLAVPDAAAPDTSTVVVGVRSSQAAQLARDLRALKGWRHRGQLVREHLFPPPDYIRARYGVGSRLALPALYIWRVLRGIPKWFRPGNPDS